MVGFSGIRIRSFKICCIPIFHKEKTKQHKKTVQTLRRALTLFSLMAFWASSTQLHRVRFEFLFATTAAGMDIDDKAQEANAKGESECNQKKFT